MGKEYSEEYKAISKEAEGWQDWKKETYNVNFATSKHAKKLDTQNNNKKTCWNCLQRIGEECGIDGREVFEDSDICGAFEED